MLITGASSGIGESFAYQLAARGAHLILTARNLSKLEEIAGVLKQKHGIQVSVFGGDLGLEEIREKLFDFVRDKKQTVDVLINNAGFAYHGAFDGEPLANIQDMIAVNIEAVAHLTKLFLPGMIERKTGGILNVASTAAYQPIPYLALYAATKAFVLNLSEALSVECGPQGVRVFCLCPGNTRTQFHATAGIEEKKIYFGAPVEPLVRFALDKFLYSSRSAAIYGFWNKLMIYPERLAPRGFVTWVTKLMYQPSKRA